MVTIRRAGEATGTGVNRLAVASVSKGSGQGPTNLAVTAARDDDGNLSVVVWAVDDAGKPKAVSSRVEGAVSEVAVCAVGARRVVAAMRDGGGRLRLIAYAVSASGKSLTRLPDTEVAGTVRDFAMASMSDDSVTVALRGADRRVVLSTWNLDDQGRFSGPRSIPVGSGKVRALDLGAILFQCCLMVATDTGTLRFRAFTGPTAMGGDGTGGKVRAVSIDGVDSVVGYWTGTIGKDNVAVRTGALGGGRLILDTGLLEISNWEIQSPQDGLGLARVASGQLDGMAGIAYELRVLNVNTPVMIAAASGVDTYQKLLPKDRGKPKLRVFAFERKGEKVVRVGQANSMGKHSHLGLVQLLQPGNPSTRSARVLTAAANGDGRLRVEVWDVRD